MIGCLLTAHASTVDDWLLSVVCYCRILLCGGFAMVNYNEKKVFSQSIMHLDQSEISENDS